MCHCALGVACEEILGCCVINSCAPPNDLSTLLGIPYSELRTIASLNDDRKLSFRTIARIIEAKYIWEVLCAI